MATTSAPESSQDATFHFVLPAFAVLATCFAPCITVFCIATTPLVSELVAAFRRRLSVVSIVIIYLSCVFFLSNWSASNMYAMAAYSVLLAMANIIADKLGRKRVWIGLAVWHAVNLLNLMGFAANVLFIPSYNVGSGLLGQIRNVGSNCKPAFGTTPDWCNNVYVAVQLIVAFLYILLQMLSFLLVVMRVVEHYGGDETGPGCELHVLAQVEARAPLVQSSEASAGPM